MDKLTLYIESLIFASQEPIGTEEIQNTLEAMMNEKVNEEEIEEHIDSLKEKYQAEEYSFELVGISKGYQFLTKGAYHPIISQYLKLQSKKRLSRSALETLAIIAYKQPMTKAGIEQIRGVNCDYAVQKLVEKELIEIEGRAEGPGRPLLYGTSMKFLDHFGIKNLADLPKLKEINVEDATNNIAIPNLEELTSKSEPQIPENNLAVPENESESLVVNTEEE